MYLKNKCFSAEWIQNFLGHASYKTTIDMYRTLSIDEMQQKAGFLLLELQTAENIQHRRRNISVVKDNFPYPCLSLIDVQEALIDCD